MLLFFKPKPSYFAKIPYAKVKNSYFVLKIPDFIINWFLSSWCFLRSICIISYSWKRIWWCKLFHLLVRWLEQFIPRNIFIKILFLLFVHFQSWKRLDFKLLHEWCLNRDLSLHDYKEFVPELVNLYSKFSLFQIPNLHFGQKRFNPTARPNEL